MKPAIKIKKIKVSKEVMKHLNLSWGTLWDYKALKNFKKYLYFLIKMKKRDRINKSLESKEREPKLK